MITKDEAIKLRALLKRWNYEYHTLDKPTVSDAEYDASLKLLTEYENAHPEFSLQNSPTQSIGGGLSKKFTKFVHQSKMYSLDNAFNHEELIDFDKRIKKILSSDKDIEYFVEFKIDGVSISLHYENGILQHGVTRGDGTTGEDITNNVLQVNSIPKVIKYKNKIEVRGEIYLSNEEFAKLNSQGNDFANPRNATAGTLRQLDFKIVKVRNLSSFIYAVVDPIKHSINTQEEVIQFLNNQGFTTNYNSKLCKSIVQVLDTINHFQKIRDSLPYDVDGIVIKVNDERLYEEIGYTTKFPRFMIAYKFTAKTAITELLDIFPTIGRTGRVTYNAKLLPVSLSGTTTRAATLHNADYIKKLAINIGDRVEIKKAGEIIPKVIKVSTKVNHSLWKESTHCPICKTPLVRFDDEVDQYCINENCLAKLEGSIIHFASRNAMNIEGLGEEIVKKFIELKLITSINSIYQLHIYYQKLINLENFGVKSVDNLLISIEKSKKQPLDKFLFALGIRHIGEKTAKVIAQRFGNLEKISNLTTLDVMAIRDMGEKVSKSLIAFFNNEKNREMIQDFKQIGINPISINSTNSDLLIHKTFVITGTLLKPRKYYEDLIIKNNGNLASSISSKTNYLLAGDNAGSKLEKAKTLNVKIIGEQEFLEMIKENK